VPTAAAVFTTDVTIRPFAAEACHLVRWTEFSRGGHFAALEAPDLLTADLRAFFAGVTWLSGVRDTERGRGDDPPPHPRPGRPGRPASMAPEPCAGAPRHSFGPLSGLA
jgi:hypothetical protein